MECHYSEPFGMKTHGNFFANALNSLNQEAAAILEVCQVSPAPNSPELSLPLTYFDILWLKSFPVENIFFYQLSELTQTRFTSVIIPTLKHSLSLTLTHFSPLAGCLTWPPHDTLPSIFYKKNDYVLLIVAESTNPESFISLTRNKLHKANESRPYVPELHVTDSEAAVLSLQVTLFPNHGIAIGISNHHAILDGKSTVLFLKAWAHMNRQLYLDPNFEAQPSLPPELSPFLDRSVIRDPEGIAFDILAKSPDKPRSLELIPANDLGQALVRATFEVSPKDVSKLGIDINNAKDSKTLHLSTFVLAFSRSMTCLVKAKNLGSPKTICFGFPVDSRARLEPPIPSTYLGNCIGFRVAVLDGEEAINREREDVLVAIAKRASEGIKELDDKKDSIYEALKRFLHGGPYTEVKVFGVAWSPRFEVYKMDFGWGRPVKVEVTSIDRTGAISFADRKDGLRGVEIGLVLTKEKMDVFVTLFDGGLKSL